MTDKIAIHWFRQDLRLTDNPALNCATQHKNVLPIYIFDDVNPGRYAIGSASKWWLHHSLEALNKSLNGTLSVYKGNPQDILDELFSRFDVEAVYWNRCYEPWRIARDTEIKKHLKLQEINVRTFNGSLLWEPWDIHKLDGTPYKVFTPFYNKGCLKAKPPRTPIKKISHTEFVCDTKVLNGINSLNLLPITGWDNSLNAYWHIGEVGAEKRLKAFFLEGIQNYKEGRDFPSKPYVSRLSPHLHFGEISPNTLWYGAQILGENIQIDHFCREIGWREFSYSLLYNNPDLPQKALQPKFNQFPWVNNTQHLKAWQKGMTGIPIVDAGMRELWQTGYMHNRIRMIVGSFLTKNLLIHWNFGERWFWDTLADADLANNSASWQWIAGCGADAAPYFRIFNPVTQSQRFDPDGIYIRQYIPEIAKIPNNFLFAPWEAPEPILQNACVKLGETYPNPIVDLKQSRNNALSAYQSLKSQ